MAAHLALDLTVERISLLEQNDGQWHRLGEALCEASNLSRQLDRLRSLAQTNGVPGADGNPAVLAVLPPDQVIYGTLSGAQGLLPGDHLAALLEGQTPYPVSALRFDWRIRRGNFEFAAVPCATLVETADFLRGHGFDCVGVITAKGDLGFDGTPWFGTPTAAAPASMAPEVTGRTVISLDRRKVLAHPPAGQVLRAVASPETLDRLARATHMNPAHQKFLPDPDQDDNAPAQSAITRRLTAVSKAAVMRTVMRGGVLTAALVAGLATVAFWPQAPVQQAATDPVILRAEPITPDPAEPPSAPAQTASDIISETASRTAPLAAPADVPTTGPATQAPQSAARTPGLPPAPNLVSDQSTFYTPAAVAFRSSDVLSLDVLISPGLDPDQGADALALDAVVLPTPGDAPTALISPPPPDVTYAVDARGLVRPSPTGQITPEGFSVFAGRPSSLPTQRPEVILTEPSAPPPLSQAALAQDDPLRGIVPTPRPAGIAERYERADLGGRSRDELGQLRPRARPVSIQEAYALKLATASAAEALSTKDELVAPMGPRPRARPSDMAQRYLAAKTAPKATTARTSSVRATAAASTAGVTARPAQVTVPAVPTRASVTEQATISRAMDLARINLLGTFGSNSSPRALVRMPNGRVVNLSVGDNLDGGRVASIGQGRLSYVKSGKTVTLNMPKG